MKTLMVVFAALITYSANAQTTTAKHDIGIRLSSDRNESFQLQYRFHKNERWSFFVEGTYGGRSSGTYSNQFVYPDSLFEVVSNNYNRSTIGLNFGAQRRLSFMEHNFYYVGASVGVGTTIFESRYNRTLYLAEENEDPNVFFPNILDVVETESSRSTDNIVSVKSKLFVGADFPLVNRLNLNFELGMNADMDVYTTLPFSTLNMHGYFVGGLRYQFGKTK